MMQFVFITLKSILRDRIFHGIGLSATLFLLIPVVSSLSMRQGAELSVILSLSLLSFILLLLSVFLGGTTVWRDIDRRYTYSVLSLPVSRTSYLTGKFLGIAFCLFLITVLLGCLSVGTVWTTSLLSPPERPINWGYLSVAILFIYLKYTLLTACAFFFSTFSTSFFLPVFGTITTYIAGSAMQQVYDYVNGAGAADFSPFLTGVVTALYYLLPNLSAFDLHVSAVYGIPPQVGGILLTFAYFCVYTCIVMSVAALIFRKREIK
jgi:ABC-type transport system involved in multi-copper enzyme maturation permease subunit